MRDAHQSLLATRVRTYDLLRIAPATAHLAPELFSLECWGGATFDVAYRFLNEDPWDAAGRAASGRCPTSCSRCCCAAPTPSGYTNYPDNVVEAFIEEAAEAGHRRVPGLRLAERPRTMEVAIEAVPQDREGRRGGHLLHRRRLEPEAARSTTSSTTSTWRGGSRTWARTSSASRTWPGCSSRAPRPCCVEALREDDAAADPPAHARHLGQRHRRVPRRRSTPAWTSSTCALAPMAGLTCQPSLNALVVGAARLPARPAARPTRSCSSWPTTGRTCASSTARSSRA